MIEAIVNHVSGHLAGVAGVYNKAHTMEQATTGRLLSAAEWLLFELYRAAQLNGGRLGLDKRQRRGSILKAWELIEPHTALRRPSLDRIEALIAQARRDLSQGDYCEA